MKRQEYLIKKQDWDILIILDACRYFYFKKVYADYLEGNLTKVLSPASHTSTWLIKTFKGNDFEDVVYISGNPFINSKKEVAGFDSSKKFHNVRDVWDFGGDESLGTVRPETISQELLKELEKDEDLKKRYIVHYMQPHGPYIGLGGGHFHPPKIPGEENLSLKGKIGSILSYLEKKFSLPLPFLRFVYLFRLIAGIEMGPVRKVYARYGLEPLRKSYRINLKIVMASLSQLLEKVPISKKVIVTADHRELLGDTGFSHPPGMKANSLRVVPWLEIKNLR